jgi:hypothetical protein
VVTQGANTLTWASRFAATFAAYPPGFEHELLLVCNGGPPSTEVGLLFEGMNTRIWPRENDPGWDISGYINAARGPAADADLIVALGETCYFHRAGWLKRTVEAFSKNGHGMYGFFSSNVVRPHMNTTGFATVPSLLRDCPIQIRTRADRYLFEHGPHSFWRWIHSRGMPTKLITWDGEWDPRQWRAPTNILWRGDQSNCLLWCNHADAWANTDVTTRTLWSANSDRPFHDS